MAAVLAAATPSWAQTNTTAEQPFVFPGVVTTSPSQALPFNASRQTLEFCNPNATISCAVCPAVSRKSPNPAITCALNGAGSVTLPPSACWGKSVSTPNKLKTAWNVVCSGSGNFTAFETE